jgi:ubiquinone/menaquinone biosynthesis C-methylase UbiE
MRILDIGCGNKKLKAKSSDIVIGLDIVKLPGVDVVHNLEKFPWPFKKNEFDYIYANNVLEHLTDIIKPIEELHRIIKNHGILHILVPIYPSINMFVDPTHKSFFTHKTFDYFTDSHQMAYYSNAKFQIVEKKILFNKWIHPIMNLVNKSKIIEKIYFASFCHIIPPSVMEIKLRALKSFN